MTWSRLIAWTYVGSVLVFLFAPVVVMVAFSFNSSSSESSLDGLSVRWFAQAFRDPAFHEALANSLRVAAVTACLAAVLGTTAALGLARLSSRWTAVCAVFFSLPLVLPGLFAGIALLASFSRMAVQLSFWTVVAGHVLITIPLVIAIVGARLERVDRSLVEAARDLGAGSWTAFRKVTLPQLLPAIVGSVLLSIAWSLDEFIITLFVNGGTQTVPLFIFGQLHFGLTPAVNAVAAVMLAITVAVSALAGRFVSARDLV